MMKDIQQLGFEIQGLHHLTGKDFLKIRPDRAVLLDVRLRYELSRMFDVENLLYCPYPEVQSRWTELPKEVILVVADAAGLRSKTVALMLMDLGFKKVCNLAGGIVDWEREGNPVTKNKERSFAGPCMCQLKNRIINKM